MPASAAAPPPSPSPSRPETLVSLLGSESKQVKLKALRELKNQIIGNRTKKLCYINLGTVPSILEILTSVEENGEDDEFSVSILIQSAATIGSFACGVDDGVRAVLDAGGFGKLIRLISHPDDKVVDAGARALKMIYQSKWAPKYDFNSDENMAFLLSLLNSLNENVTELGCSIITHSCETSAEQKALCEAGVLSRLIILLKGSLSQREATLDSLAAMFKNNSEVISKFVGLNGGRALNSLTELMKDKYPRTRLLACVCLAVIGHTSPSHLQDPSLRIKLITILIELFEEPGRVGDEVPFALANLITKREDLQKLAFEVNALDKLCSFLHKDTVLAKQLEGILLSISELCSSLEDCRAKFLSLQVLDLVTHALTHDCSEVRTAACICIRSVSRSVKNLSAGHFLTDTIVTSLIQLLHDQSTSVQVAALKTISNIVVDFSNRKSIFIECGGLKELVVLSKSMDSTLRQNSVWALKNLTFHAQSSHKEHILSELTASTLTSLICDSEPYIQEQALSLVRNLVDGGVPCIEHLFTDGNIIIDAVGRQVRSASKSEVCIQGMFALSNIATGSDLHKEAVMEQLVSESPSIILKFLQCADSDLRLATMWCIVNLTYPGCHGTSARVARLRDSGVISEVKHLVSDPHLEVKFRVRMALEQCKAFSYKSE